MNKHSVDEYYVAQGHKYWTIYDYKGRRVSKFYRWKWQAKLRLRKLVKNGN